MIVKEVTVDNLTKQQRSCTMSKIRSKNTKIELRVFKVLRKNEIYFQRHYGNAPGKPDIAITSKKKVVFINGDFWHGYRFSQWKNKLPKKYWQAKIESNIRRDKENNKTLKSRGWKILIIWEHNLKNDFDKQIDKILKFLKT